MPNDEDMPNWDIAIAGMVNEKYTNTSSPLSLQDFRDLAKEYDFRLDDIMETVFLMVMHNAWEYIASPDDEKVLDHETLIKYCTLKRMSDEDLMVFRGKWKPMDELSENVKNVNNPV